MAWPPTRSRSRSILETGGVRILRYVVANDCGRAINPMIVEGQIVGGTVHGIGNALFEWMGYDENAQPMTTNFGDYLLATAPELPPIERMLLGSVAAQSARRQGRRRSRLRARRRRPSSPRSRTRWRRSACGSRNTRCGRSICSRK